MIFFVLFGLVEKISSIDYTRSSLISMHDDGTKTEKRNALFKYYNLHLNRLEGSFHRVFVVDRKNHDERIHATGFNR